MKSLVLLSLLSLPSTLALAVQARQQNAATTSPSILPILPKPDSYTQALVAENCARWDRIGELGFNKCESALELYRDVTYSDLILWNPSVGPSCDTMWYGYWFCTAVSGPSIPLPPARSPAGVAVRPPVNPLASMPAFPTCDRWDQIPVGSSCGTFMSLYPGLTLTDIQTWNPFIIGDEDHPCGLTWPYYLCTSVVGHVFPIPSPPTQPGSPTGAHPPGPTQAGVALACMKWDIVKEGDTCQTFLDQDGVTMEELVSWNPAVGPECTGLWGGYAVCVGV